jgi:hypothetical protein
LSSFFWTSTGKRASSPETEKETRFAGKEFQERRIFENSQEEFQERITVMTFQNVSAHFLTVFLRRKFHMILSTSLLQEIRLKSLQK